MRRSQLNLQMYGDSPDEDKRDLVLIPDEGACDQFVVILWLKKEEEGRELPTSSSSVILKASG